jgi:hypothetical protein
MSRITGDTPHGSTDAGNPLGIGGYASATAPTAVTAGQRVKGWFDLYGRIAAFICGDVAHDAADSGNPLKIGGKASTSAPTAVAANDRVNSYHDAYGRQVVVAERGYQDSVRTATISADMQAATAISAAPGASLKLVVDEVYVSTVAAEIITFTEETSGTVLGTLHTTAGGVHRIRLGKLATANKKLMAAAASAGDVSFITFCRYEA